MGQWMQLLTLIMILRLIDFDWTLIFFFFSENWTKVLFAVLFATYLTTNLIRICPQDNDLCFYGQWTTPEANKLYKCCELHALNYTTGVN